MESSLILKRLKVAEVTKDIESLKRVKVFKEAF